MKLKSIVVLTICIATFIQAVPPPPGTYNPLWQSYLAAKARLGIDRPINPVRDIGKKGLFNTRLSEPQTLISGTKNIPAVLIEFSDYGNFYDTLSFQNMLFGTWPSGSAHDYFLEVSYDTLNVTGKADGWYLADYNHDYYGYNSGNGFDEAAQLAKEAAQKADNWLDYSQFDNDQDGYVDLFTVIHAGYGAEETGSNNDIWSHKWSFSDAGIGAYTSSDLDPNNPGQYIKIDLYTIQPERSNYSNNGTMVCIGIYCHEWGHGFGLPDLYDTDGGGSGLGNWCLMAGGSWGGDGSSPWYPSHLSAWAKMDLGWITPITITKDSTYSINQVETNGPCYLLPTAVDADEYFLIENRQNVGFDTSIIGTGLCIYHIDDDIITLRRPNNQVNAGGSYPYGVALEQADGLDHLWDGTNRGDAGDVYPGSTNNTAFDSIGTTPDSRTNDGGNSKCGVNQISSSASTMQAHFYIGPFTISIPVIQNPFLHQYMDIWVAPSQQLTNPPQVSVITSSDTTDLTMTQAESSFCYRGDYKLTTSGQITIYVQADSIDTSRVFTAQHISGEDILLSANGQMKLNIPEHALSRPTWLTVVEERATKDENEKSFGLSDIFVLGPEGLDFAHPGLITVSYSNSPISKPEKLGIYKKSGEVWVYCGGVLNKSAQSVSALVNSTGSYQVRYDPTGPNLINITDLALSVMPNPNHGAMCIMYNLFKQDNVKLGLYDVTGSLVARISDKNEGIGSHIVYWNSDSAKQSLNSGVYFLVLGTDSYQQCVKLIITK